MKNYHDVSGDERGKANLTERNFNAICEKFSVNPEWLRNGVGDMFIPLSDEAWLDDLARKKGLSPEEKALIASIVELPPAARKAIIDWAIKLCGELSSRNQLAQESSDEKRMREIDNQIDELQRERENLRKKVETQNLKLFLNEAG